MKIMLSMIKGNVKKMPIAKYHVLLKVAELGSITRAADALGYTQSAVSRIIADLEAQWAVCLFTRNRTGAVLSSAGEVLLPRLLAVCNAQREVDEEVAELHGLTSGTLRIGTFTSISIHWLPEMMKSFLERYPGIQFQLNNNMEYAEIEDWIMTGRVDCGFIGLPSVLPLETAFLRRDRLLAVLPLGHPLAEAESYPMTRFSTDHVIHLSDDRDREYARIFDRLNVRPNAHYSVNDDYVILSMVASGLGVSILPELVVQRSTYPVITKPLDPPQFRDIGIAARSFSAASPVTNRFLSHVQAWIAENHAPV